MKKKILCIFTIILTILAGCAKEEKSNIEVSDDEVGIEIMEGMNYLVAGNDYGFYFDVYSKSGDKKNNDSKISVNNGNDNLYFMIENAGEDRQIAVQIFIDYIQVPMIIEGETYQTFFVDTDKSFSKEFCFQIAETLDESVDHKIMAAMTVYSDKHVKDSELEYTTNGYSIALDAVLDIAGNTDQFIMNKLYNYENPREFVYHVGGYDDCTEALVILCMGMEQVDVNQQKYMLFKLEKGKIQDGLVTITMPDEQGCYDLTGWIIKNPFSEEKASLSGEGQWRIRTKDSNGYDQYNIAIYLKEVIYFSLFISGEGLLDNRPPWYLFDYIGDPDELNLYKFTKSK